MSKNFKTSKTKIVVVLIAALAWVMASCGQDDTVKDKRVDVGGDRVELGMPDSGRKDVGVDASDLKSVADAQSPSSMDMNPTVDLTQRVDDLRQEEKVCGEGVGAYGQGNADLLTGCTTLTAPVYFIDYYETDLPSSLRSLRRSTKSVVIRRAKVIEDILPLSSLEQVDDLQLSQIPELSSLQGLSSLTKVNLTLELTTLPIKNLKGLERLEEVGGLYFVGLPNVSTLEPLNNLTKIGGDLIIESDTIPKDEVIKFIARVKPEGKIIYNGSTP